MNSKRDATRIIVSPEKRLDTESSSRFQEMLDNAFRPEPVGIILNLIQVEYITSLGLRIILSSAKRAKEAKIEFCLCGASGAVAEILQVSAFHRIIACYPTLEDAQKRDPGTLIH